jgi:exodeoxyribonuclease VII large subunit
MWQVSNDRKQIETMRKSMDTHLRHRLALERERIVSAKQRLDALSPLQILKRGYAIVRDLDSGAVVSSIREARADHLLEIRVGDGAFGARVVRNRAAESRELWDGDDEDDGVGEGN